MALECNFFADATPVVTACQLATSGFCTPSRTLTWEQIALLALDALIRTGTAGAPVVTDIDSAEAEQIIENALCALQNVSIPQLDPEKLKVALLFVSNGIGCVSV